MSLDALRLAVTCLAVLALLAGGWASGATEPEPAIRLPAAPPADNALPDTVVVERGDHLWSISERQLDVIMGRTASDPEVGPYWRKVIEANVERLRSGDPDLIYPGEVVVLPDPANGRP